MKNVQKCMPAQNVVAGSAAQRRCTCYHFARAAVLYLLPFCAILFALFSFSCQNPVHNNPRDPVPPEITAQPRSAVYTHNSDVVADPLVVAAMSADGGILSYQWFSAAEEDGEGAAIPGASLNAFTPPINELGVTYYYAEVTNTLNGRSVSRRSDSARIEVTTIVHARLPVITSHPRAAVYTQYVQAEPLTVTATLEGEGTLSYQWYSNTSDSAETGTAISGETDSGYTPPTDTLNITYYYCVVTNTIADNGDGGEKSVSAVSNTALIEVNDKVNALQPHIAAGPRDGSYTQGDPAAELTVTASSSDGGTLSYQWYSNTINSNENGSAIHGETDAVFTPRTTVVGAAYYYVEVTNTIEDNGDGGSKSAVAASDPAQVITRSLLDGDVVIEGNIRIGETITVNTDGITGGDGAFTWRWQRNGIDIAGAYNESYVVRGGDAGAVITCIVGNEGIDGSVTSNSVKVPYDVVVSVTGERGDDAINPVSAYGDEGDVITLEYTLASINSYNELIFSNFTGIATVLQAGSAAVRYTIHRTDASDGRITIIVRFFHTNLTPDPVVFSNAADPIHKVYGDTAFDNPLTNWHKGSGAITYSSSNEAVATVNSAGRVTLRGAGEATITAEKEADETYAPAQRDYTLIVTPRPVIITGLGAANKTYDNSDAAVITGAAVVTNENGSGSGLVYSDTASMVRVKQGTARFDTKDVILSGATPAAKTVSFHDFELEGGRAEHYELIAQPEDVTAVISPLSVTISGITIRDKIYDRTTVAEFNSPGTVVGRLGGDDVYVDLSGATAAFGYYCVETSTLYWRFNAGSTLNTGIFGSDFRNFAVRVTGLAIAGSDVDNYTLTLPSQGAADFPRFRDSGYDGVRGLDVLNVVVEQKAVTITASNADKTGNNSYYFTKVYDGNTNPNNYNDGYVHNTFYNAVNNGLSYSGVIEGDTVSLITYNNSSVTAAYADKNVGTHTITFGGDIKLTNNNYTLTNVPWTTGSITPKEVRKGDIHSDTTPRLGIKSPKAFDGTRRATLIALPGESLDRLNFNNRIAGDDAWIDASGAVPQYESYRPAANLQTQTLPISSFTITGVHKANYMLSTDSGYNYIDRFTGLEITKRKVTFTGVVRNKPYDGNAATAWESGPTLAPVAGESDSGPLPDADPEKNGLNETTLRLDYSAITTVSFMDKTGAVGADKEIDFSAMRFYGYGPSQYDDRIISASTRTAETLTNYELVWPTDSIRASIVEPFDIVLSRTTFTPLEGEKTANVTITGAAGFDYWSVVNNDNFIAIPGFTFSRAARTLTYNGGAFANPEYIIDNGNGVAYPLNHSVTITVYDGGGANTAAGYENAAGDRRIPVTAANFEAFKAYAVNSANAGKIYKLQNDITLTAGVHNWTPLALGTLYGQGHFIKNLTINLPDNSVGLFVSGGAYDLGLPDVDITGSDSVGGIAGSSSNGDHRFIVNCYVTGAIRGRTQVGGITGTGNYIRNCYSAANVISSSERAGGIAGQLTYYTAQQDLNADMNKIIDCYSTGSVSGNQWVGGIVGYMSSGINGAASGVFNCYATGAISSALSTVGGTAGISGAQIGGGSGNDIRAANSVALNKSIATANSDTGSLARVAPHNNSQEGGRDSLYARSDMSLLYNLNNAPAGLPKEIQEDQKIAGGPHGADITQAQWSDVNWWNNSSTWTTRTVSLYTYTARAWDFTNVWDMGANLPILRNMPSGHTQNPAVTP